MARKLYKKQERILDKQIGVLDYDSLSEPVRKELDKINLYENICSDVERYLRDREMDRRYGKK